MVPRPGEVRHMYWNNVARVASAWVLLSAVAEAGVPSVMTATGVAVRRSHDVPEAAHGRMIVKYASSVQISARSGGWIARSEADGRSRLAQLDTELGVRILRPLTMPHSDLAVRSAETFARRLDLVRSRFPKRAARAPAGLRAPDLSRLVLVEIAADVDPLEAAQRYQADAAVEYAEPDYLRRATVIPDDPFFSTVGTWGQTYPDLWGLHLAQADGAWNLSSGQGVTVAVVDTGIDLTHPDLAANVWTNPVEVAGNGIDDDGNGFVDDIVGWDFYHRDADPTDRHGHGTHVAGTVAAVGDNGIGVLGMAWSSHVMAVRGLGADGRGFDSDLIEGILYAAENGADVINNSWGGYGLSQAMADAIATARSLGAVVVAAAGNDGTVGDHFSPAGEEGVVAVAASDPDDSIASFSNFGELISVAAPGVDVLSLRGAHSANTGGQVVADDYLRLSGTSMASPHVAGLAAVLLSAMPTLTVDEVQWHLELNADQPGYPGYEAEPWNPHFGWGRINAASVFTVPPTTTRLRLRVGRPHVFAGTVLPALASADLRFTTTAAVAWTASTSPWLELDRSAGSGDSELMLSYDASGLVPGLYAGTVAIDAPSAADGGASGEAAMVVHRDDRVAPETLVGDPAARSIDTTPRLVSNGIGTIASWVERDAEEIWGSPRIQRFDAAGNPGPVYTLKPSSPGWPTVRIYAGGDGYLLHGKQDYCANVFCRGRVVENWIVRIGPDGVPLDPVPIVIERRHKPRLGSYGTTGLAYDGDGYVRLVGKFGVRSKRLRILIQRFGRDGTLDRRRKRLMVFDALRGTYPKLACNEGSCLLVYLTRDPDGPVTPGGFFVNRVQSLRLEGDRLVSEAPVLGTTPFFLLNGVISDGNGYLAIGQQHKICGTGEQEHICRWDVVAARLAADGTPLDPAPIILDANAPLETSRRREAWTGTVMNGDYFVGYRVIDYGGDKTVMPVFLAHIRNDGTVVADEEEGRLAFAGDRFRGPSFVGVAADARHLWVSTTVPQDGDLPDLGAVVPLSVGLERPDFVPTAIGAIGSLWLAEHERLRLALAAPGLDPAATTFSASGLPEGAVLDAATGLFSFEPNGAQSGTYANVRFEASDGVTTVSETTTINVAEAALSLSGVVTFAGAGAPAAGVAIELRGLPNGRHPIAFTDGLGRYRFGGLVPNRRYRLAIGRLSRRTVKFTSKPPAIDVGNADVRGSDLVVEPR